MFLYLNDCTENLMYNCILNILSSQISPITKAIAYGITYSFINYYLYGAGKDRTMLRGEGGKKSKYIALPLLLARFYFHPRISQILQLKIK